MWQTFIVAATEQTCPCTSYLISVYCAVVFIELRVVTHTYEHDVHWQNASPVPTRHKPEVT